MQSRGAQLKSVANTESLFRAASISKIREAGLWQSLGERDLLLPLSPVPMMLEWEKQF
jgi:hypothetical protein